MTAYANKPRACFWLEWFAVPVPWGSYSCSGFQSSELDEYTVALCGCSPRHSVVAKLQQTEPRSLLPICWVQPITFPVALLCVSQKMVVSWWASIGSPCCVEKYFVPPIGQALLKRFTVPAEHAIVETQTQCHSTRSTCTRFYKNVCASLLPLQGAISFKRHKDIYNTFKLGQMWPV